MPNPSGLCLCGCGQKTPIAAQTNKKRGHIQGEPCDYVRGHGTRRRQGAPWAGELPLCACGCGQRVELSKITEGGRIAGQPNRFLRGHYDRSVPPPIEVDRGYVTPCHIYQGQITKQGYPRRESNHGTVLVHRQVYIDAHGPVPDGIDVHHRCEQTDCVRLDHLELWTRSQHIRSHRGITPEKYEAICDALRSGESSQAAIARRFGVSKSYIWELRRSLLA